MEQTRTATKIAGNNVEAKLKNVWFYIPIVFQIIISAIVGTGTKVESLQTWPAVWDMIIAYLSNPFLLSLLLIQIYGQLKSFDTKGPWRDNELTNSKIAPTHPDIKVVKAGETVVDDDTVILADNVDGEAVEDVVENEKTIVDDDVNDKKTYSNSIQEEYNPDLAGPEVYANDKKR